MTCMSDSAGIQARKLEFPWFLYGLEREHKRGACINSIIEDELEMTKKKALPLERAFKSHARAKFWHPTKNMPVRLEDVTISSGKKYWFTCGDCSHDFNSAINNITRKSRHHWCPFCARQKLCTCTSCHEKTLAAHPKGDFWHATKNKGVRPEHVTISSGKKYWFTCGNGHDFCSKVSNITKKTGPHWCPHCVNKTEYKMYEALLPFYPTLERQFISKWCRGAESGCHLPFDFCIPDRKILIELDGRQHFQQVSNWRSHKEQSAVDKYKEECANKQGYCMIRLLQKDVWGDAYDWLEKLRASIAELSHEVSNVYLSQGEEYACFGEKEKG